MAKIITNQNIRKLQEGKTISISKLPDCRHKARLTAVCNDLEEKIIVLAVLEPNQREWIAYVGYPDIGNLKPVIEFYNNDFPTLCKENYQWLCENVRDVEQVRIMGEKLPKEAAEFLFPDWADKIYRE